ncbi:MAG TPA: BglII/BstYI family type II restriction endonuclease [Rhizomicrobium sp.]|nr:BglII/BstYI family type II restriction endonuclease [Rhizomicrobium sp.]
MANDAAAPLLALEAKGFQIRFLSHARAILTVDFPQVLQELADALATLTIPIEELVGSGGGESKGTQRLRRALASRAWTKKRFEITKTINGEPRESTSHEMDHVREIAERGIVALEIEWNNKDPFFDRDLENFKRVHAEGAISVGIIITRGSSLQDGMRKAVNRFAETRRIDAFEKLEPFGVLPTRRQRTAIEARMKLRKEAFPNAWVDHFVSDKYGSATTHWRKLEDRIQRRVGNPCPLLLIGLPDSIVTFD